MEHLYINYISLTKKTNPLFEEKLELVRAEMSKDRFKKMPGLQIKPVLSSGNSACHGTDEKELRDDVNKKTVSDFLLVSLPKYIWCQLRSDVSVLTGDSWRGWRQT